jgi:predicted sulfurtransferase
MHWLARLVCAPQNLDSLGGCSHNPAVLRVHSACRPPRDPALTARSLPVLGLGGRIIVSEHGINGTVGGELREVKTYLRTTREYLAFRNIDLKWARVWRGLPRLGVRVRDELVSFGTPRDLQVDENGVIGGGTSLNPKQLPELVEREEVVFLDSGTYDHRKQKLVVTY